MQAAEGQPVEQFKIVLEAGGGRARRVREPREVAAAVARIARGQGTKAILYEPDDVSEQLGLRLLLAAHGIELVRVADAGDGLAHFPVALTSAELGIAETGTILVGGRPGGWGLAGVLPWVHVVVLRAETIVADLPSAFERFEARLQQGERDWVWITGPSRTADIGHTLVLGAHGPNALEVLVVG